MFQVHLRDFNVKIFIDAVARCDLTRINEERSFLVWHGGLVFHNGQTALSRGRIEVVHRNFIVSAAEIGVWTCHPEVRTIAPNEVYVDWILSVVRS